MKPRTALLTRIEALSSDLESHPESLYFDEVVHGLWSVWSRKGNNELPLLVLPAESKVDLAIVLPAKQKISTIQKLLQSYNEIFEGIYLWGSFSEADHKQLSALAFKVQKLDSLQSLTFPFLSDDKR